MFHYCRFIETDTDEEAAQVDRSMSIDIYEDDEAGNVSPKTY